MSDFWESVVGLLVVTLGSPFILLGVLCKVIAAAFNLGWKWA